MKIHTLLQMQQNKPDWIVIRSFGEKSSVKKEISKGDFIPQYLRDEEVKKWNLREVYNKSFLSIEI